MKENKIRRLKIAFIGGGINSVVGSAHYSAISLDNVFNLVAGCFSRHKEINYETAERYKVSKNRTYSSIDELVKNEKNNVDAIIVLTPTNQHAFQVINLINNDIPVICEKSLACSGDEVEQIKTALQKKNGFLAVIYNYLGYPLIRELRHMIKKGILGKINHIQIEMPQEGFVRINQEGKSIIPQEWRLKDGIVPTISLDLGVHLHMFVKYLTNGSPINVVAKSESIGNFSEIVDNVNCIIEYTNNLTCNMWYSKIAIGNRNGLKITIYGSEASAEWLQEVPEILHLADVKGNRWKIDRGNQEVEISNQQRYTRFKAGHPAGFIEAFANYYQDIANALQDYKKKNIINFKDCFGIEEAYEGIQLLEAIQRSSKSRTWEKV
jgi:predicted dehydrogenase